MPLFFDVAIDLAVYQFLHGVILQFGAGGFDPLIVSLWPGHAVVIVVAQPGLIGEVNQMAPFAISQRFLPITRQQFPPKAWFDIGLTLAHLVGFEHVVIKLLLINSLLTPLSAIA